MQARAPFLQGGKKSSGQSQKTQRHSSSLAGIPNPSSTSVNPTPFPDPAAMTLASNSSKPHKKPLIKAAEFAAAMLEASLPPLPPITRMPHISLHPQPPHGLVVQTVEKGAQSRRF